MKKKGIGVKLVDSNNYTPSVEVPEVNSAISQIPDPIRYFGGAFWTAKNGKLVENSQKMLYSYTLREDVLTLEAEKSKFIDDTTFINGILIKFPSL